MHVLMTADTVGGVWTYTQELVSGLIQQGIRVTLVSLGKLPSPQQSAWIDALPELDCRPTDYRLEWMQDSERDVEESGNYLESVIREVRPDLLHLNQYCYGTVSPELPRIVVAHSDVVRRRRGSCAVAMDAGCSPNLLRTPGLRGGGLQRS